MNSAAAARRRVLVLAAAGLVAAAIGAKIAFARMAAPTIGNGVVVIETNLAYQNGAAAGTGMVLTSSGTVLTNNHVIAGATTVKVVVPGTGRSYTARVAGYDVQDDVALLRLQHASNLKTVSTTSSKLSLGSVVRALGNAGGTGSLTSVTGRVTGLGKTITASDDQGSSEQLSGLIETNAAVQPGDSGGPLLNSAGRVVGMTTAASARGFGFSDVSATDAYAIPITKALTIAKAIAAGKSSTAIHIGPTAFLGIQVQTDGDGGVLVAGVVSNGPAANAGLQGGDVITSIDGRSTSTSTALRRYIQTKQPGAKVTVAYVDQTGYGATATVTLGSGPPQ
ncbi:MAG TPA: trypsin-like peptidase domain-containing protein [Gaiellaceae bacterium]|nr:trypsin-like peptidase domain-containing protein [Gaiellaceae bacterium]